MLLSAQTILITFIPDFQRNIHIGPFAFNIVGIQDFRILSFQYTAFATCFAIVEAFPGIKNIIPPFFLSGLINFRWYHLSIKVKSKMHQATKIG